MFTTNQQNPMTAISYTVARENLASTMDNVCQDHNPVIITRGRKEAVVMMSLEDYSSWEETVYLMSSPANAQRLLEGIMEIEKGNIVQKKLSDLVGD
jgi:antitoxin YefM